MPEAEPRNHRAVVGAGEWGGGVGCFAFISSKRSAEKLSGGESLSAAKAFAIFPSAASLRALRTRIFLQAALRAMGPCRTPGSAGVAEGQLRRHLGIERLPSSFCNPSPFAVLLVIVRRSFSFASHCHSPFLVRRPSSFDVCRSSQNGNVCVSIGLDDAGCNFQYESHAKY